MFTAVADRPTLRFGDVRNTEVTQVGSRTKEWIMTALDIEPLTGKGWADRESESLGRVLPKLGAFRAGSRLSASKPSGQAGRRRFAENHDFLAETPTPADAGQRTFSLTRWPVRL